MLQECFRKHHTLASISWCNGIPSQNPAQPNACSFEGSAWNFANNVAQVVWKPFHETGQIIAPNGGEESGRCPPEMPEKFRF